VGEESPNSGNKELLSLAFPDDKSTRFQWPTTTKLLARTVHDNVRGILDS